MYIAMNRFEINAGREPDFEKLWKERETFLAEVPGFKEFHLLRGPGDEEQLALGHGAPASGLEELFRELDDGGRTPEDARDLLHLLEPLVVVALDRLGAPAQVRERMSENGCPCAGRTVFVSWIRPTWSRESKNCFSGSGSRVIPEMCGVIVGRM